MGQSSNQSGIQPHQAAKAELRQQLRARRLDLALSQRSDFDDLIRQHLYQLIDSRIPVSGNLSIAAFWPFDGEPDITPVCRRLWDLGGEIALPVIGSASENTMNFHHWHRDTQLEQNSFGIYEPQHTAIKMISEFDILLIPIVGYDRFGNRLGMGGGYYDRQLAKLNKMSTPLKAGIAYSLQETAEMGVDEWDIPLHGVVNENGWFTLGDP